MTILTNQPLRVTLHKPDLSRRMMKWAIKLSKYDIQYKPCLSLKFQILTDFIVELPQKRVQTNNIDHWWILHVDGASEAPGIRVVLLLLFLTREPIKQSIHLDFSASNNEAEYEAIIIGLELALALATSKVEIRSDS